MSQGISKSGAQSIPQDQYRSLLSSFPAAVNVVTAFGPDGRPRGLTVTAFAAVSIDPPLILVCVDKSSNTLPAIVHSGGFTVNLVEEQAQELARLMASKAPEKFETIEWLRPANLEGGPILYSQAAAHIVCKTWRMVPAGDHIVLIGLVIDGDVREGNSALMFHRRQFFGGAPR